MLTVQTAKPHAFLQPFIHCYVQREFVPSDGEFIEPVMPRIGAMLEFQFAAVYDVKAYGTESLRPSWATTIIGPIDARRVQLVLRDRVQSLVVLFRNMGLFRLLAIPVSPLRGAGAEAHAACGPPMSALHERLGNTLLFAERSKVLDAFFLNRLRSAAPLHPTARALHLLASTQLSVNAAANQVGIGERQLERRALELIGLSPKALSRIARFQRAIRRRNTRPVNWLEVAHAVGYYDQMHMIRDFHDLAGGSPTQVLSEIEDNHLISFALH